MAKGKVELIGLDDWLQAIRLKLGEASERVENTGLRSGGEVIAEEMRLKAPFIKKKYKTKGKHIQDDIKVSGVRRADGMKYVLIGPGRKTGWRAHFIEFGVSKRDIPAQPFIYPAFHEKKSEALDVLIDAFRKGLEEG